MRPLTDRQHDLLRFIENHLKERGYQPSIREMADHMGIRSTNGVNDHLKALERKGYIKRHMDSKSRAITLVERPENAGPRTAGHPWERVSDRVDRVVNVPLVGRIAAGKPVWAEENMEDVLCLDASLTGPHPGVFALRVTGESMVGKGILDGDYVLVKPQKTAESGRIVVALVDGEATVKTLRVRPDAVVLQPENPAMQPIEIQKDDTTSVDILGVVISVFRKI